jgi:hypothetical protein
MRTLVGAVVIGSAGACAAAGQFDAPVYLTLQQDVPSVYAPPMPATEDEGLNQGGVNVDLEVRYMTDYVFRGFEFLEVPDSEDSPNLQLEGSITWDLGKLPHPFIGVFVNIADQDPISEFQEIRPFVGLDWEIRPFTLTFGHNSFIYPDRDDLDTSEVYAKVTLNDAWLWSTEKPLLSPYVFGAYDYDQYDGWYLEAGVEHTFELDDIGIDLTLYGAVAYVYGHDQFLLNAEDESGFQHWQVGAVGRYSLNKLLNTSERYGRWEIVGYINYTGGWDNDLRADDQLWGGAGIAFHY